MATKELKEYLSMLIDMEKNIFTQKETINNMQYKIKDLGIKKNIQKPSSKRLDDDGAIELIGGSFALIIGILLFITCICSKQLSSMRVLSLIIIGTIFFIIGLISFMSSYHKKMRYEKDKYAFEDEMEEYKKFVKDDKKRVRKELIVKKYIESEMQKLNKWVCQDKCVSFLYFYGGRIIRPPFPYKYQLKGSSSASSGSISDARLI